MTILEADVAVIGAGSLRVAALVGILPADSDARPHLTLFEDAADVLSDRHGLWFPEVDVGTPVARGTGLGRLEDAFGDTVWEVLAPAAGVLTFGLSSLAATPGDLLASIARPLSGT
jgi:predicted deacylase